MKNELYKMIDAVMVQDNNTAEASFNRYLTAKASAALAEAERLDMFAPDEIKQKHMYRYLVKPIGIGYDDPKSAIVAAKNHPELDVYIIDTELDTTIYSHRAASSGTLNLGRGKK